MKITFYRPEEVSKTIDSDNYTPEDLLELGITQETLDRIVKEDVGNRLDALESKISDLEAKG